MDLSVVPALQVVKMKQAAMAAAAEFTWSNAALQYEAIFQELGVKDVLGGRERAQREKDGIDDRCISSCVLSFPRSGEDAVV